MTRTPHTRESETELREILAQELDKKLCHGSANMIRKRSNMTIHELDAALAAMRRISTPLTPSDEMVGAGARAILATLENSDCHELELKNGSIYLEGNFSPDWVAHAVIQAALNLMGGKK